MGTLFVGYGLGQFAMACRAGPFGEWLDRALPAAGGVLVGGLFAFCAHNLLAVEARGLGGAPDTGGHSVPAVVTEVPVLPAPALPEIGGPTPLT